MPVLLLFRHAKSSWDDPALADFDRPLAPRGQAAAPLMGEEIARRGWQPDHVLLSPALRAWQSWDLACARWRGAAKPHFEDRLYMATPATIRTLLHAVPAQAECVMIVGHNPGLADFALDIAGPESERKALKRLSKKFPTAALARFETEGPWTGLQKATTRLTHFLRPKDLA